MIAEPAHCMTCRHLRENGTCAAFPELPGIPLKIWDMDVDHRHPYPGDRGIQWEPKEPGVKHPLDDDSNS